MRILICQIARMGDVLQTSPLIRVLRAKHPDAHIAILVRKMGRVTAERIPEIDEILEYEEDDIFRDLRSGDSDRYLRAYERIDEYVQMLRNGRFDIVYNCTHSVVSAILCRLSGIPRVYGADYSEDWRFVLRGAWTNYFFTGVFTREYNDLNICDVCQRYENDRGTRAGLSLAITDADRAEADALLREYNIGPDAFLACFQLGASDDNKRWSAANFAALGKALAEHHGARIALVGVKGEARYGERFEALAPGLATHLFGKTSIGSLAALLERANLLVTNDTGTMHIAAAAGCPICLTSVGYVHFRETGPYAANCVAIERKRPELKPSEWAAHETDEREQATPEQVLTAVEYCLALNTTGQQQQWVETPALADVHVYASAFAADDCLIWHPVIRRAPETADLIRLAYRAMWLENLDSANAATGESQTFSEAMEHFEADRRTLEELVQPLIDAFSGLESLAQQGVDGTTQLLEALDQKAFAKAQEITRALMRLDDQCRVYSELNRCTRPIVVLARFGRDNLEGADPVRLAQDTLKVYQDMAERAGLMQQKLINIISAVTTAAK